MPRARDFITLVSVCQGQGGFEVVINVVEKDLIVLSTILQAKTLEMHLDRLGACWSDKL